MLKSKPHFKEVRKRATNQYINQTSENVAFNPSQKVSFRGIRRLNEPLFIDPDGNAYKPLIPYSPLTPTLRSKTNENSQEKDFHKFSTLLQSKGYSNNPAKPKCDELSFRTFGTLNTSKHNANTQKTRAATDREMQWPTLRPIDEKCRQIKNRQYTSSRQNAGELNSLGKLRNKLLISPLKKKKMENPMPQPNKMEERGNGEYEHSSILSEHDLVNMSKANDTIDFDMSPCL